MVQKYVTPTQGQTGDAQALTLTATDAAQLMATRIERKGNEIGGITVVLPLGEGKYLRGKLPDETVQALRQKLLSIPQPDRPDFLAAWINLAQNALSVAYEKATAANPQAKLFAYSIPPMELPKAEVATTPVSRPYAPMPVIITKTDMHLDTAKAKPTAPVKIELPPLPKGVKGKGTTEKPYLIDLTDKAPKEGPTADLEMPIHYENEALGTSYVYFKYKLKPSQLKEIIKNQPSDVISEVRSLTSRAIERYGAEHGITTESLPRFSESLDEDIRNLPRGFKASANRSVKDPQLREYLALPRLQ